jgi:hypothetical protein
MRITKKELKKMVQSIIEEETKGGPSKLITDKDEDAFKKMDEGMSYLLDNWLGEWDLYYPSDKLIDLGEIHSLLVSWWDDMRREDNRDKKDNER